MSLVATLLLGKPINLPTGTPRTVLAIDLQPRSAKAGLDDQAPANTTAQGLATQRQIVETLRQHGRLSAKEAARKIGCHVNTIRYHLAELKRRGIIQRATGRTSTEPDTYIVIDASAIDRVTPAKKPWTTEDDAYLKDHLYTCPMATLAQTMRRGRGAIMHRAKLLGLIY